VIAAGALAAAAVLASPPLPPDVREATVRTTDGYSFRGEVVLPGAPSCLLDVVFRPEHVRAFAGDYEVTLVREGDGWNEMSFRAKGLLHDVTLVYRRTLHRAGRGVAITLVGGKQDGLLPRVLASDASYSIVPSPGGMRVGYEERVTLSPGLLRGLYVRQAAAEARAFMERLRDHALRTCP
jgi:hypothetical protein